jgi:hypothetical protein
METLKWVVRFNNRPPLEPIGTQISGWSPFF